MYRVYIDDVLMYKPDTDLLLQGAKLQQNLNSSGSFVYTIDESNECYNLDKKMKSVVVVKSDDKVLFRGRVLNSEVDFYGNKTVTCEGDLSFLIDSIQKPFEFQGTPRELFEQFITAHNSLVDEWKRFKIGFVTVVDDNDYIARSSVDFMDTKKAIEEKLVKLCGGYIRTRSESDGIYIDYLAELTDVNEQTIEFGQNLLDINKITNGEEVATAIIPLGAKGDDGKRLTIESVNNGLNYVSNVEAVEQFGWIFKTVEYDDVTIASNLKTKGLADLESLRYLSKTVEVTAVDLSAIDKEIASFEVGKLTNIRSKPHDIQEQLLTTSRTINLLNPSDSNLVLGGEISGLSDIVNSNANLKDTIESLLGDDGNVMAEQVRGVLNLMNTSLKAQLDETHTSDVRAILFENIDETSATFGALSIGTQGIQISRSRDSAGEWIWGTAINFEAINADMLLTGIISDRQGRNYWNLETGEFSLSTLEDYATTGDLESLRGQTTSSLNVMNDAITAKVSTGDVSNQLSIETGGINISGNRFTVDADNFNLTADGTMTCTNGMFKGQISTTHSITVGNKIYLNSSTWGNGRGIDFGGGATIDTHNNFFKINNSADDKKGVSIYGSRSAEIIVGIKADDMAGCGIFIADPLNGVSFHTNSLTSNTSLVVSSDERLKENIEDLDLSDILDNFSLKSFNMKDFPDENRCGIIAQSMLDTKHRDLVVKDIVKKEADGTKGDYYAVKYDTIYLATTQEVLKLRKKVEELEAKINEIGKEIYDYIN